MQLESFRRDRKDFFKGRKRERSVDPVGHVPRWKYSPSHGTYSPRDYNRGGNNGGYHNRASGHSNQWGFHQYPEQPSYGSPPYPPGEGMASPLHPGDRMTPSYYRNESMSSPFYRSNGRIHTPGRPTNRTYRSTPQHSNDYRVGGTQYPSIDKVGTPRHYTDKARTPHHSIDPRPSIDRARTPHHSIYRVASPRRSFDRGTTTPRRSYVNRVGTRSPYIDRAGTTHPSIDRVHTPHHSRYRVASPRRSFNRGTNTPRRSSEMGNTPLLSSEKIASPYCSSEKIVDGETVRSSEFAVDGRCNRGSDVRTQRDLEAHPLENGGATDGCGKPPNVSAQKLVGDMPTDDSATRNASGCVQSAALSEISRKKPRVRWGEGLVEYEKKKFGISDDSATRNGGVDCRSIQASCSDLPNMADQCFPGLASPITPSSVGCSSSPGIEKRFPDTSTADNATSRSSGSQDLPPSDIIGAKYFDTESLDATSIANVSSSLSKLVEFDYPTSEDSSFVRATSLNKLQVCKGSITKALEMTESEIDSLENELKSLVSDTGTSGPCPVTPSSFLGNTEVKTSECQVVGPDTISQVAGLQFVSSVNPTVKDHENAMEEVPDPHACGLLNGSVIGSERLETKLDGDLEINNCSEVDKDAVSQSNAEDLMKAVPDVDKDMVEVNLDTWESNPADTMNVLLERNISDDDYMNVPPLNSVEDGDIGSGFSLEQPVACEISGTEGESTASKDFTACLVTDLEKNQLQSDNSSACEDIINTSMEASNVSIDANTLVKHPQKKQLTSLELHPSSESLSSSFDQGAQSTIGFEKNIFEEQCINSADSDCCNKQKSDLAVPPCVESCQVPAAQFIPLVETRNEMSEDICSKNPALLQALAEVNMNVCATVDRPDQDIIYATEEASNIAIDANTLVEHPGKKQLTSLELHPSSSGSLSSSFELNVSPPSSHCERMLEQSTVGLEKQCINSAGCNKQKSALVVSPCVESCQVPAVQFIPLAATRNEISVNICSENPALLQTFAEVDGNASAGLNLLQGSFLQKCNSVEAGSSSARFPFLSVTDKRSDHGGNTTLDLGRPCKSGEVKLFGKILTITRSADANSVQPDRVLPEVEEAQVPDGEAQVAEEEAQVAEEEAQAAEEEAQVAGERGQGYRRSSRSRRPPAWQSDYDLRWPCGGH